jgi:hypothetical protein
MVRTGRRTSRIVCVAVALIAGASLLAGVEVEYDDSLDFGMFETYAWKKGKPARHPEGEKAIREAAVAELMRLGLREVESGADLWVSTHVLPDRHKLEDLDDPDYWEFWSGVASVGPYDLAAGTLVVDVEDTITGTRIWRGIGTGKVDGPFDKAEKKAVGLLKKIFKRWP